MDKKEIKSIVTNSIKSIEDDVKIKSIRYSLEEIKGMMKTFLDECDDIDKDETYLTDRMFHKNTLTAFLEYIFTDELGQNSEYLGAKEAEEKATKERKRIEDNFKKRFHLY